MNIVSVCTEVGPKYHTIPLGVYPGRWCGYFVETLIAGANYRIEVDKGMRGIELVMVYVNGPLIENIKIEK